MVASSGFQSSPGHAALGDALRIAPADRHGHQKWMADKVHLFVINNFAIVINLAI
jgi:hypothetical protein